MTDGYWLTPEYKNALDQLLHSQRRGRQDIPPELSKSQSPEVYVARPSYSPIPKLTHYLPDENDQPGYALCDIYRITQNTQVTNSRPELQKIGVRKKVFNLNISQIPKDSWLIIQRTKSGQWVCVQSLYTWGTLGPFVQLKTSLAPGNTADVYEIVYESGQWNLKALYISDLFLMGFHLTEADAEYGSTKWVASFNTPFDSTYTGRNLDIVANGTRGEVFNLGEYVISDVVEKSFSDLQTMSEGDLVYSAASGLSRLHVGLLITITDGTGGTWIPGNYRITAVDENGIVELDGSPSSPYSTGGIGTLTPYAILTDGCGSPNVPFPVSPPSPAVYDPVHFGHAIAGLFTIYDWPMNCHRGIGTDDLMTDCNRIHLSTSGSYQLIENQDNGEDAVSLSVEGLVVIIDDDRNPSTLYSGVYWIVYSADYGGLVLSRPATDGTEHYDVKGYVAQVPGSQALAFYCAESDKYHIASMKGMSQRCEGVTVIDLAVDDEECVLVNVRAMDTGQSPVTNHIIAGFNHLCVVYGSPSHIYADPESDDPQFNSNDIGFAIYLDSFDHATAGWYLIENVGYNETLGAYIAILDRNVSTTYTGLSIPVLGTGTEPLEESSEVENDDDPFVEDDVDLWLTITGVGQNDYGVIAFYTGNYNIDSVYSGVATAGPTEGTAETVIGYESSYNGVGYFTGMKGGTGFIRKPIIIKSNSWSGESGSTVTAVWNEEGDDLPLDSPSHEYAYYQLVREYPANPASGYAVFVSVDGVVDWDEGTEDYIC